MKSTVLVFFFLAIGTLTYAQKGFNVGANFAALSTNIINQNTWGIGREYDYEFTINTSYGLDVGYNFSDQMGIYSGIWFTTLGQDYSDNYNGSAWERSVQLKYSMIPVMLKFTSTKAKVNFLGGVGVLIASLSEANQEWLRDGNPYVDNITNPNTGESFNPGEEDVTDRFNQSDIILNIDLGGRILLGTNLHLDLTLNMGYGFNDINAEDWQIPHLDGEYELSRNAFAGIKAGLVYVFAGK